MTDLEDLMDLDRGTLNSSFSSTGCWSSSARGQRFMAKARHNLDLLERFRLFAHPDNRSRNDLTYRILYEFLPVALTTLMPDVEERPKPEQVEAAAATTLALATLLGFSVAFLDYLVSIPWNSLSRGYSQSLRASPDKQGAQRWTKQDAKRLANTPIHGELLEPMLNFLFNQENGCTLPAALRQCLTEGKGCASQGDSSLFAQRPTPTWDAAAALLDGATPIHCAAVRGSICQVQYLLGIGADPYVRTAAGELPMELVPVCMDGYCSCPWAPDHHQGSGRPNSGRSHGHGSRAALEPPAHCHSREARNLLARRTVGNCACTGLLDWLRVLVLSVLCILGLWGHHTTILRPAIERRVMEREERRREQAREHALELMQRMRFEASDGAKHLARAKALYDKQEPGDQRERAGSGKPCRSGMWQQRSADAAHSGSTWAEAAELAFESFVRAVHACQSLELRGGTVPKGLSDLCGAAPGRGGKEMPHHAECHVLEDEQAEVYSCWARAVLLKFRGCMCQGCNNLAAQASRMAHVQVSRLFRRMERKRRRATDRWHAVGCSLASVIYTRCCLLLDTDGRKSVTKEGVAQAEQCLEDWDSLEAAGLTACAKLFSDLDNGVAVECLREWAVAGSADLRLAEALRGKGPLEPSQSLSEALAEAVDRGDGQGPSLRRPVTKDAVEQLEAAVREPGPASSWLLELAQEVAKLASREFDAAQALRDAVNKKWVSLAAGDAAGVLESVIAQAREFPNLAPEVEAAESLRERCRQRAVVVSRLEAATKEACSLGAGAEGCDGPMQYLDKGLWTRRLERLTQAVTEAQEASIAVGKAKRLLQAFQLCASAAEAVERLDGALAVGQGAGRHGGSGALKSAMSSAEEIVVSLASIVSNHTTSSSVPEASRLAEELKTRLSKARDQMARRKAAEALAKVLSSCKAVQDLPKLESAILAARKVGAEELDRATFETASELRCRLSEAARLKSDLAEKLRGLLRQASEACDSTAAESVGCAITAAEHGAADLLEAEIRDAREQLEKWRTTVAAEARLSCALREAASSSALSRAIQEAQVAGVKVSEAKKVLKAMQALESMLSSPAESVHAAIASTRTKVQAAEAVGIKGPILAAAKARVGGLCARQAKDVLEAALKPRSDIARSADERCAALKAALAKGAELSDQQQKFLGDASAALASAEGAGTSEGSSAPDAAASALAEMREAEEQAHGVQSAVELVERLLVEAKQEQERVEAERALAEKQRREKAERERAEKEERDRERKEKAEAEKQERERLERERRERGRMVAEAAERQRRQRTRKERKAGRQAAQQSKKQGDKQGDAPHKGCSTQRTAAEAPKRSDDHSRRRQPKGSHGAAPCPAARTGAAEPPHGSLPSAREGGGLPGTLPESQRAATESPAQKVAVPVQAPSAGVPRDPETQLPDRVWARPSPDADDRGLKDTTPSEPLVGLELKVADSWHQLEMLTQEVLEKLADPVTETKAEDPAVIRAVSEPPAEDHQTYGPGDDGSGIEGGAAAPRNGCAPQPASEMTLGAGNSSPPEEAGDPDVGASAPERPQLSVSVGGLPLAGFEYGGTAMWSMPGSTLQASSIGSSASALLPELSGLGLQSLAASSNVPESSWGFQQAAAMLGFPVDPAYSRAPQAASDRIGAPWPLASTGLLDGFLPPYPRPPELPPMSLGLQLPPSVSDSPWPAGGLPELASLPGTGSPAAREPSGPPSSASRPAKPGRAAARVLRVPRVCRYHLQGFCRDGPNCRFSHDAAPKASQKDALSLPPQVVRVLSRGGSSSDRPPSMRVPLQLPQPPPPPPPPPPPRHQHQPSAAARGSSLDAVSEASLEKMALEVVEDEDSFSAAESGPSGESTTCCVCLERPREVGLAHENGVLHCCICRDCAERLKSKGFTHCPLCMERITQFVHRIYL
uniref:C3H1-type domain-containing protein n=1 Tax=Tetraselmis sp. GSL018 TaxID=582737 RepID=A0A061QIJ2_9CHLO